MKIEEIDQRVENIRASSGDYEAAHGMEDDLYRDVLQAIAAGAEHAPQLAAAALNTKQIVFARYAA